MLYINDLDNDTSNPTLFILYSAKGFQINYLILFPLLFSNIAKPIGEAAALFTLKHREAKRFASGNSVAKLHA